MRRSRRRPDGIPCRRPARQDQRATDDAIAYAPVTQLSCWIERRMLTSERLTTIYLDRIRRFDPKLRCVITLTRDIALARAKQADAEMASGRYRGPLHGIPYGVKDLLDTANIPTTCVA
jgi:Asp-tRNA(Asn)/Glu-tRNA(Gln) amidotransferase A subunit family amidase